MLDAQVRAWLAGVEPAWTLLTFESLQALRQEPSATQTAIRIANDLSLDEIAGSPIARNTLVLLREVIKHGGLALTASGNLTRAVVAEMCKLIAWPDFDQADAFRFNKVINEPDFTSSAVSSSRSVITATMSGCEIVLSKPIGSGLFR